MVLAEKALAEHSDEGGSEAAKKAQKAYDKAVAKFEGLGGYGLSDKASSVLTGLSFSEADFSRPCSELSGGWQMKVALARALLSEPSLLLLDEPTNHMDVNAKRWLASYLSTGLSLETSLLLVTHDRALLENIRCTNVLEISAKRILSFDCDSIAAWETERLLRTRSLQLQFDKLTKQNSEDIAYVRKWGSKTSHATLAQAKKKKVERRNEELAQLKEAMRGLPEQTKKGKGDEEELIDGTLPLAGPSKVRLQLPEAPLRYQPPIDKVLLSLRDGNIGYNGAEVLSDVELAVSPGSRMALLGPNGCGKSTLLRALAGAIETPPGVRRVGVGSLRRARVALFTQDLAQDLPMDKTPVEYVLGDGAPATLDSQGARSALGALGLRSEVHLSKIGTLSGGEKARVALAVFATRPADVLLLDEPTNHLDGAAVAALSAGLLAHTGGAVVVASHDQAFVDGLQVTGTVQVKPGGPGSPASVSLVEGLAKPSAPTSSGGAAAHSKEVAAPAPQAPVKVMTASQRRRMDKNYQVKIDRQMKKIEDQEEVVEAAEQEMNTNYTEEAYKKYQRSQAKLDKLYAQLDKLDQ